LLRKRTTGPILLRKEFKVVEAGLEFNRDQEQAVQHKRMKDQKRIITSSSQE